MVITGICVMRKDTKMETIITQVPKRKSLPKFKRVAAYTRVSANKDEAHHSLAAQVSYYNNFISSHKGWIFSGVYSDEGRTGTKIKRSGFQDMLQDARDGKIDLIITKSVSRFARSVVVLLSTIRELTKLNVDVYFEEQKVHSISKDGEFLLTVIALYAEMEAKSASNNMLWKIQKTFEQGKIYAMTILGYRLVDGNLVVEPNEAKTVKTIFKLFLEGYGAKRICNYLNERDIKTRHGKKFVPCNILYILKNSVYTGDITLQKTFRKNISERRSFLNNGEKTRYFIEGNHKPLIDKDTFELVQKELKERQGAPSIVAASHQPFRKMIVCAHCGNHFGRHACSRKPFWSCTRSNMLGQEVCPAKKIPEEILINLVNEILNTPSFDEVLFKEKIQKIVVTGDREMRFVMNDGNEITKTWEYKSRRESWTQEMRDIMAAKTRARYRREENE